LSHPSTVMGESLAWVKGKREKLFSVGKSLAF